MAKKLSPAEIADKQVRRAAAAVNDYKAGVMGVSVSPTQEAAKAADRWKAGIEEAYNNGSFVDGCNSVSLGDWQSATAGKGAMNFASGVSNAKSTIEQFHMQSQSNQAGIDAMLRNMPRGDISQNLQRMLAQVTEKAKFRFKKRRAG